MNSDLFSADSSLPNAEQKNKKVYPSQLNSKTIAARVPVSDYVRFLQSAIDSGISLSDWLLIKIYRNENNDNNSSITIPRQMLLENDPLTFEYWKTDLINESIVIDIDFAVSLLSMVARKQNLIDQFQQPRVASLNDVKAQLTILIKERFPIKDQITYRRELFKILKELED